jgi:exopolysaccharide production protein ExoQ
MTAKMQASTDLKPSYKEFTPMRSGLGLAAVSVSVMIMAYAGLFGVAPILVFYAIWLPQIFLKGTSVAMPSRDTILYFVFCLYLILSTLWSDYRSVSLYTSLEYTSLTICTVIMYRLVSAQTWIRGIVVGCCVTSLIALLSHKYASDPFSKTTSLVGYFGSKNQVGLYAEVGAYAAFILYFFQKKLVDRVVLCVVPFLICTYALIASKSAASDLSLIVSFATLFSGYFISRLPRRVRGVSWLALIVIISTVVSVGMLTGLDEVVLQSFGKDSTLTGRTYLWGQGIEQALKHPLLGDGYNAFWVQGRPEAETFWYHFDITGRGGFHFHNLFIQVFVDLGIMGVAFIALIMLRSLRKSVHVVSRHGMYLETAFALGISIMLLTRAMVEVDVVGSFAIGPVLLFSILPMLVRFTRVQPPYQGAGGAHASAAAVLRSRAFPPRHGMRNRPRRQ